MSHNIFKIITKIILFSIIIGVLMIFTGTPWDIYSNYRKASQYLKNKYAQEIIIKDSVYDFKFGGYYFFAYPEGRKDLVFSVVQNNKGMIQFVVPKTTKKFDFKDNLFIVMWEKEINDEISTITKSIYSCSVIVRTNVQLNNIYNDYEKNIAFDDIPKFSDIKNKIDWDHVIISFYIDKTIDKSNLYSDAQKIFIILDLIKKNGYKPGRIDFSFNSDKKSENEYIFIYHEDLEKINNIDDVRKLIEEKSFR